MFGARLRITGAAGAARARASSSSNTCARATAGPIPADARPNDLVHWQTTLVSDDAEAVARAVRGSPCAMLSPGVAAPSERELGFTQGAPDPRPRRACPEGGRAMSLAWGREICGDLPLAESREWLCTNGIGGFASGTVVGRPHGQAWSVSETLRA